MRRFLKTLGVVLAAIVLTTVGISASDTLQGVGGTLVGMVIESGVDKKEGCPSGMAPVSLGDTMVCVDIYEASAGTDCPHTNPRNAQESERNLGQSGCVPVSAKDMVPWRFINVSQAQRACALAGKQLPTNAQWYRAALGTPTHKESCYLFDPQAQQPRSTQESDCRSVSGMYDMVGNVWEWVDEGVTDGTYKDRSLPPSGYVTSVDLDGVGVTSGEASDELYQKDFIWTASSGARAMIRGGFYGSGDDGGLYTLNASIEGGFTSTGVGFRCVRTYEE